MLLLSLWKSPLARIAIPSDDKIELFKNTVEEKYDALHDVLVWLMG